MFHLSEIDEDHKVVIEVIAAIIALVLFVFGLLRWS